MSDSAHAASERPTVSVIIVSYNSGTYLAECLTALTIAEPTLRTEILVVDNASKDNSLVVAEAWARQRRDLHVVRSQVNRGYAGGVNLALSQAQGKYIAVLNPDMLVSPGWLTQLVAFLETHPSVGAVNPLIVLRDSDERINAAGQDVHLTGLGFNRWLGQPRSRAGSEPIHVSGLQGGAFVIRHSLLDQMGGWDDSGFLYHEDVELSWTLQLMGYDLYCLPMVAVWHHYHLTMYPQKLFLLERNRLALLLTHLETLSLCSLAPFLLCTEAFMWSYCLLRGWDFLKAKAASYQWIIQHRESLQSRKVFLRSLRRRTDGQVLRRLNWGYAWDQFLTLGRERGPSHRMPEGGLPVNLR